MKRTSGASANISNCHVFFSNLGVHRQQWYNALAFVLIHRLFLITYFLQFVTLTADPCGSFQTVVVA